MKIKDVRSMKLTMQLKSRSYDIILKAGCLANLHQFTNVANRKVFVLTDSGVPAEYAQTVAAQCPDSTVYTIPRGEGSKCLKVYGQVLQAMLAFGMDRKDLLVSVGGGHFSGRITAASVAAGTICETVLNGLGVKVYTHIAECAGVQDAPLSSAAGLVMPDPQPGHFALLDASKEEAMQAAIRAAGSEGDSVGGILETIVTGLPAGIGEPWFDSVESELAHLMFAIPACKGIEFGAGFGFAAMHGSQANDPFTMRDGKIATATNKNGGINGGITNGMPIVFRTVLKPTPSIYKQQHTVDYIGRTDAELQIKGRHDPCIVPRAAVVQNSLTAFGLLDLLTVRYGTLAQKHGFPKV